VSSSQTPPPRPLRLRPVAEIKPIEILDLLKRIEASGRRDTAHRLRATIGSVFRYAVATLRADTDPTYALRGALSKVKVTHRAAITDEREVGRFLVSAMASPSASITEAIRKLPLSLTKLAALG
jgi:integrase